MLEPLRASSTSSLQTVPSSSILKVAPPGISSSPSRLVPATAAPTKKGLCARLMHKIAQCFRCCFAPFLRPFRKKNTPPPSLPPRITTPLPAPPPPRITKDKAPENPLPAPALAPLTTPAPKIPPIPKPLPRMEPKNTALERDTTCRNAALPAIQPPIPQEAIVTDEIFLTQCRLGDENVICELMGTHGLNFNATDTLRNFTALHYACERRLPNALRQLLERGANAEIANGIGTPLHHLLNNSGARDYATDPVTWDMMLQLLRAGAHLQNNQSQTTPWSESLRENTTPLTLAVARKDLEAIRLLIRQGAPVNAQNPGPRPILLHACENENAEVIRTLAENGADMEIVESLDGNTALAISALCGHEENIWTLTQLGARVNPFNSRGESPLHLACRNGHAACMNALIALGAPVNSRPSAPLSYAERGRTPLHTASLAGQSAIVRALTSLGAEINARDDDGNTALGLACEKGKISVVHALIEKGAKVNPIGRNHPPPLFLACLGGHLEIAKKLLAAKASTLPLFTTTLNAFAVLTLIKTGIEIDCPNSGGNTLLWHFINSANEASSDVRNPILGLLLRAGAQVNRTNGRDPSPFQLACKNNLPDFVETMLSCGGAQIDLTDAQGNSPLHLAAGSESKETLTILLAHRANPIASNKKGLPALHILCKEGRSPTLCECVAVLLKNYPLVLDAHQNTALHHLAANSSPNAKNILLALTATGIGLNAQNARGETALHTAYQYANRPLIEALIATGASTEILNQNNLKPEQMVNHPDEEGRLPFMTACEMGNITAIETFLSFGISANAKDEKGFTALHYASSSCRPHAISVLLKGGADPNAQDSEQAVTPLHVACMAGTISKVIERLLEAGASASALTKKEMSPLHYLAKADCPPRDALRIVFLLISKGSPLEAQDTKKRTAWDIAQEPGKEKISTALSAARAASEPNSSYP